MRDIKKLQNYPRAYITDNELFTLLGGTSNSIYSKIKRWLAQGKLLHIRRGLYCLTKEVGYDKPNNHYEMAQAIYAPSYISLESALSYHQLIPEAVYTTTSVCTKRSKEFETVLGVFSYRCLPRENFYVGVELIVLGEGRFLMAKPWKAICDYVYCYKKEWTSLEPLVNSLRIEKEDLPVLTDEETELLNDYYRSSRIAKFLKGIKKDMK